MIVVEFAAVMSGAKWILAAGEHWSRTELAPNRPRLLEGPWVSGELTATTFLPVVSRVTDACSSIPGASYGSFPVIPPPTDRPAEEHADLNLALRGYEPTNAYLGLVTYGGSTDAGAPQLAGLFADRRLPAFSAAFQVHHWDWGCNCRGPAITDPPVTLLGMTTTPGETVHVPQSGYTIGGGYEVLVLYAEPHRITLKYTGEDNVVWGYTLHLEDICVDPDLLTLYRGWNDAGRAELPALQAGQAFATAYREEIGVAIRDTGAFLDPRSEKDWWQ
jgi:hypothetical protein